MPVTNPRQKQRSHRVDVELLPELQNLAVDSAGVFTAAKGGHLEELALCGGTVRTSKVEGNPIDNVGYTWP